MYTILGANGSIANALATLLIQANKPVRLVSRHPQSIPGATEVLAADLLHASQTKAAVDGSSVVFLLAGLPYDHTLWARQWPVIMRNTMEACKASKAKLIFLDNVYMYGIVDGPMTENTPYKPASKKGKVRAAIATMLMDEVIAGRLTASIARSADFYGQGADKTGVLNILAINNILKGRTAQVIGNDNCVHSYTYVPDAAKGLQLLAEDEHAWNQVWHLPTTNPAPTGQAFIEKIAAPAGKQPKYFTLKKWMLQLFGLFSKQTRELAEMYYQYDRPYIFNSTKFEQHFQFQPTPYEEGLAATIGM
ncbi:Nucleoside-diphosphate-sugar epimerase [Chitinophaga costaii]|uniref:Nucleoside-diphosphate-sugar epimerase n=1 Tax=Chitinophaga costaii TaxID=1335309 RepID=A0A1C4FGV9_9BACT|nr:NAD-dependent epimerase/dehydratase family protein [Chitinophaga costaii]PUZ20152.1 NAD-dependent dehydratase [Chitinophaga costaii]SCC55104.1 Nucleoside-diphosphate-sugar epimerase [Chitinophaga costaii]